MVKSRQYQLQFVKGKSGSFSEYRCDSLPGDLLNMSLAKKLSQMHKIECKGLIEVLEDVQGGKHYEPFFAIDADTASDSDGIEISPPYIIIDTIHSVDIVEMKQLLEEWLEFINS